MRYLGRKETIETTIVPLTPAVVVGGSSTTITYITTSLSSTTVTDTSNRTSTSTRGHTERGGSRNGEPSPSM